METKFKLFFFLFFSTLLVGFTACSDDDDDTDFAKKIRGDYKGTVTITELEEDIPDITIKIERTSKNNVKLILSNEGLPAIITENITCDSPVAFANNLFTISGTTSFLMGGVLPVPVQISGSVDKNRKAIINIVVGTAELPQMPLNVIFEGTKQ